MSRIFITGDMHGDFSISKFDSSNFPEVEHLTKDDFVIVCGDFGLIWEVNGSNEAENFMVEWLSNRKWTTLFVDGNHENATIQKIVSTFEQTTSADNTFGGKE